MYGYIEKIINLNRNKNKSRIALHKPLFLLSLIDIIENQNLTQNQIPIDDKLFHSFKKNGIILTEDYKTSKYPIRYPLLYLQNDGFWSVLMKDGTWLKKELSKTAMREKIAYGKLDDNLFELLTKQEYRDLFRMVILDTYFPNTKVKYFEKTDFPADLQNLDWNNDDEILKFEEPKVVYETKQINRVYEGFKRNWKFRNNVLNVYNQTCCISNFTIYNQSVSFIEACHIQKHSLSGLNGISNGIALNSMLHRAFDDGYLTITKDYKVKVSKFTENNNSPFRLRQFEGVKINLPKSEINYPSLENLKWHQEVIFKK